MLSTLSVWSDERYLALLNVILRGWPMAVQVLIGFGLALLAFVGVP